MALKLYQHDETGRYCWNDGELGERWHQVPLSFEDELPDMTDDEYDAWYANSEVVDGVRMGYKI